MKTRDKIKYIFATCLAIITFLAIAALFIGKAHRQKITREEQQRISRTLETYGENGKIPNKINNEEELQ